MGLILLIIMLSLLRVKKELPMEEIVEGEEIIELVEEQDNEMFKPKVHEVQSNKVVVDEMEKVTHPDDNGKES